MGEAQRKHGKTAKGKATHARYRASPKGIATVRRKSAKWHASPGGKQANAKYRVGTRERLITMKLAAGCADCGYHAHPAALHFDHIPGRGPKLFNIGEMAACSWAKLAPEIEKCEVVCANCHAIRTANRRLKK